MGNVSVKFRNFVRNCRGKNNVVSCNLDNKVKPEKSYIIEDDCELNIQECKYSTKVNYFVQPTTVETGPTEEVAQSTTIDDEETKDVNPTIEIEQTNEAIQSTSIEVETGPIEGVEVIQSTTVEAQPTEEVEVIQSTTVEAQPTEEAVQPTTVESEEIEPADEAAQPVAVEIEPAIDSEAAQPTTIEAEPLEAIDTNEIGELYEVDDNIEIEESVEVEQDSDENEMYDYEEYTVPENNNIILQTSSYTEEYDETDSSETTSSV